MLTTTFANLISFFYPLGNTPAISLTQGIPLEKPAHILLLGCGDVRNILFTNHTSQRPLDITCCDLEKAVIARNVLLLSLLIDDTDGTNDHLYWNLYYHFRIDKNSLQLLQSQSEKLLACSTTIHVWHASKYGKLVRVCDQGSLVRMRDMWTFYAAQREGREASLFETRLEACVQKTNQYRADRGIGINMTGFRSASPAFDRALSDLDALNKHYWKNGSIDLDQITLSSTTHANPMFMSPDDNVLLHYGTDPLLGFHLATAYTPLTSESPLHLPITGLSSQENVVTAARTEFSAWIKSFRYQSCSITLRFCISDAIAFSHTLQHRINAEVPTSSHWYRDRCHFNTLTLDGEDYADECVAPLKFTVIDTSNLIDHVGALNLLVATASLLACDTASTLYTEKLVRSKETYSSLFDSLFCCSLSTVSLFFDLTPVDIVTNTSAICSGEETILGASLQGSGPTSSQVVGQLFVRISWKRPVRNFDVSTSRRAIEKIGFEPNSLAKMLYQIYLKMFENEDVTHLLSNMTLLKLQSFSVPTYQRASFVALVSSLRARIEVDWQKTFDFFLGLLHTNTSHLMIRNYMQELYTWLHLLNVYTVDTLRAKSPSNDFVETSKANDLRDWNNIPPVVCVTLKVPRETLKVFTGVDSIKIGTPPLQCLVQGSSEGCSWQNIFGAVQTGFGQVTTRGTRFSDTFVVDVCDDKLGWSGTSSLLLSFYAPTWMLLLQPRTASVGFGVQSTPQTIRKFVKSLGLALTVYQTTLSDTDHVYISKSLPHHSTVISTGRLPNENTKTPNSSGTITPTIKITANVNEATGEITSLANRVSDLPEDLKAVLKRDGSVTSSAKTPFNFVTVLQPGLNITTNFPIAVLESRLRTRVARKSSYVELIAQVASETDWHIFHSFMYPVFIDSGVIVAWNMPYLNLSTLPIIDTEQTSRLSWLTTHTSMMFSARERSLRENPSLRGSVGERTRLEFKDSLFSMFMHYSGLQGQKTHVFGINCPTHGGIHMLFFVSSLRLDLSNRTVVLDAAVLPLYNTLMPRVVSFLQTLTSAGVLCQIKATEAELRLWKQVLPVVVERCRTWSHKPTCEYLIQRQIPLSVEEGQRALCSCGEGTLSTNFAANVPNWNKVAKYAVRAAISPCFSAAMFDVGLDLEKISQVVRSDSTSLCQVCKKDKRADGSGLLVCARCSRVKYCSRECQRADWKSHKKVCKATQE